MKKSSISLGTFPSPCDNLGNQKGWSSERVPHPANNSSRRHISAAATPFYSGRALPSKWEDAERWICSPVLSYGNVKNLQSQVHRRPKSKSGPIVQPGIACYSSYYSPAMQGIHGGGGGGGAGSVRNFMVGSCPFSTGVLVPDGVSVHYGGGGGGCGGTEINVARSGSVPAGWSDLASDLSSLPSSQDEKLDEMKDAETMVSRVVSRRDMATQMSPEDSTLSSPRGRSSLCPSPPSILPVVELQGDHPAKLEIREVQVDKRATLISWSKRHGSRTIKKRVPDVEDFYQNATGPRASSWDISDAAMDISKLQREEAKITAWENLQKAKAEAAVRKLEMKLEKKRSSSMDKILNKLRMAQMKAQEMRSSMSVRQEQQIPKTSHKVTFFLKHVQISSLSSCFTCHAV